MAQHNQKDDIHISIKLWNRDPSAQRDEATIRAGAKRFELERAADASSRCRLIAVDHLDVVRATSRAEFRWLSTHHLAPSNTAVEQWIDSITASDIVAAEAGPSSPKFIDLPEFSHAPSTTVSATFAFRSATDVNNDRPTRSHTPKQHGKARDYMKARKTSTTLSNADGGTRVLVLAPAKPTNTTVLGKRPLRLAPLTQFKQVLSSLASEMQDEHHADEGEEGDTTDSSDSPPRLPPRRRKDSHPIRSKTVEPARRKDAISEPTDVDVVPLVKRARKSSRTLGALATTKGVANAKPLSRLGQPAMEAAEHVVVADPSRRSRRMHKYTVPFPLQSQITKLREGAVQARDNDGDPPAGGPHDLTEIIEDFSNSTSHRIQIQSSPSPSSRSPSPGSRHPSVHQPPSLPDAIDQPIPPLEPITPHQHQAEPTVEDSNVAAETLDQASNPAYEGNSFGDVHPKFRQSPHVETDPTRRTDSPLAPGTPDSVSSSPMNIHPLSRYVGMSSTTMLPEADQLAPSAPYQSTAQTRNDPTPLPPTLDTSRAASEGAQAITSTSAPATIAAQVHSRKRKVSFQERHDILSIPEITVNDGISAVVAYQLDAGDKAVASSAGRKSRKTLNDGRISLSTFLRLAFKSEQTTDTSPISPTPFKVRSSGWTNSDNDDISDRPVLPKYIPFRPRKDDIPPSEIQQLFVDAAELQSGGLLDTGYLGPGRRGFWVLPLVFDSSTSSVEKHTSSGAVLGLEDTVPDKISEQASASTNGTRAAPATIVWTLARLRVLIRHVQRMAKYSRWAHLDVYVSLMDSAAPFLNKDHAKDNIEMSAERVSSKSTRPERSSSDTSSASSRAYPCIKIVVEASLCLMLRTALSEFACRTERDDSTGQIVELDELASTQDVALGLAGEMWLSSDSGVRLVWWDEIDRRPILSA